MAEKVVFHLQREECLVLFELLSRELDQPYDEKFRGIIPSIAEMWALDGLLGALQKTLVEPFSEGYDALLSEAATKLIERRGRLSDFKD